MVLGEAVGIRGLLLRGEHPLGGIRGGPYFSCNLYKPCKSLTLERISGYS